MVSMMTHLRSSLEGVLDQCSEDSPDYRIAYYLLQNCYISDKISIQDVADNCFVSKSTVSRFCRQIGYHEFQELNQGLFQAYVRSNYIKFAPYMQQPDVDSYLNEIQACIDTLRGQISAADVGSVVMDLLTHPRVGLLGKMQSNTVAIDLQHDLCVSHKIVTAPIMPENQLSFIENSKENTFLFVISCSGTYFRGFLQEDTFSGRKKPKITLLTNNPAMKGNPIYDNVIVLPLEDTYAKHPFGLKLFCNLVAINYARMVFKS